MSQKEKCSSVACIIPSFNGSEFLFRLSESLNGQSANFDIFVVDSSTEAVSDSVRSQFENFLSIDNKEFNHGATRQMMVDRYPNYDFYIFMTQDAYLNDEHAISNLLAPFSDERVGAVCGRQIPHIEANLLAQHARYFNYPSISAVWSMEDVPQLGLKAAFISNSFSAYRGSALREVGGFPSHVIVSEDMYVAAQMLLVGWKVAYAAEACCRHSHNYTIGQEFRRYFDIGVFFGREVWVRQNFGAARGEGLRYVKSELRFLGWNRCYLWPSSVLRNAFKLLGYRLGKISDSFPKWLNRRLSMHRRYWDGKFRKITGNQ